MPAARGSSAQHFADRGAGDVALQNPGRRPHGPELDREKPAVERDGTGLPEAAGNLGFVDLVEKIQFWFLFRVFEEPFGMH
jgi:hypothetical protein